MPAPCNNISSTGVTIKGNRVWIDGVELPRCPSPGNNITNLDGKVYIDGYEFDKKKNKWRKTLRAWWYKFINLF